MLEFKPVQILECSCENSQTNYIGAGDRSETGNCNTKSNLVIFYSKCFIFSVYVSDAVSYTIS